MAPEDEVRYRRDWAERAETGATSGQYMLHPKSVNSTPYHGQLRGMLFVVTFTERVDEPACDSM
jgi:hypothetical protein